MVINQYGEFGMPATNKNTLNYSLVIAQNI